MRVILAQRLRRYGREGGICEPAHKNPVLLSLRCAPTQRHSDPAMTAKRVHLIAAARPNFMKVAPLYHALARESWCTPAIVHTGQHYDANMSDAFFRDLGLPDPHFHLGVGSGSHAEQTGGVMIEYEKVCIDDRPDWIIVVGDVNSTAACALVAVKLGIPVAHLEAGLRSGDRSMPEEINRIVTDAICDLLWTPSADGDDNLRREGVEARRIERVGNIMIDSLELQRARIEADTTRATLGLQAQGYGVVTLHRPSNVDRAGDLGRAGRRARACGGHDTSGVRRASAYEQAAPELWACGRPWSRPPG